MNSLFKGRFFLRDHFLLLLGACLGLYFSYHAIAGQRGLVTLHRVQKDLTAERARLHDASMAREALERRVVMLRPDTLDLDYAEELSLATLGYQRRTDVTVLGLSPNAAQQ